MDVKYYRTWNGKLMRVSNCLVISLIEDNLIIEQLILLLIMIRYPNRSFLYIVDLINKFFAVAGFNNFSPLSLWKKWHISIIFFKLTVSQGPITRDLLIGLWLWQIKSTSENRENFNRDDDQTMYMHRHTGLSHMVAIAEIIDRLYISFCNS